MKSDPSDTITETPKTVAETHENKTKQNITDCREHRYRISCSYLRDLLIHSLAAANNNPATSTIRTHRLFPIQFTTLILWSQLHQTKSLFRQDLQAI